MWAVPSDAVFMSLSSTVFALAFVTAYAIAAVRLGWSMWRRLSTGRIRGWFWLAYDGALLAVTGCAALAVSGRWSVIEESGEQYSSAREQLFVADVTTACRAHSHVSSLASVTAAMALFRASRLANYASRETHVSRAFRESTVPVATVTACAAVVALGACATHTGGALEFLNAFIMGQNACSHGWMSACTAFTAVPVFLLFNAVCTAVITKYYAISKIYSDRDRDRL